MGMRSMNALVVKAGHQLPAVVSKAFDVAEAYSHAEGTLWVWETNISPLWARTGVLDLQEEVTILGWLLTLPATDYHLIRCGEECGSLGAMERHPFRYVLHEAYMAVRREYDKEMLEQTPDAQGRYWSQDTPPHIGWYLANPTRTGSSWRYWTGKQWSTVGIRGLTAAEATEIAKLPECEEAERLMWWSDFWPEGLPLNRTCPPPEDAGSDQN